MSEPEQPRPTDRQASAVSKDRRTGHAAPGDDLLGTLLTDLDRAGFHTDDGLVRRFVASLLTKRFVILTGVTGSGKTKLGQVFASWLSTGNQLCGPTHSSRDSSLQQRLSGADDEWLPVGASIHSGRVTYRVDAIDALAVQFSNKRDGNQWVKVTLPRELIEEWVAAIQRFGFTRATAARTIREQVAQSTEYSTQLNSFETHLKAAAFAMIEQQDGNELVDAGIAPDHDSIPAPELDQEETVIDSKATLPYAVVAVGADWNASESVLGYPDALQPSRYVRTPTLDLILRAADNPSMPHFLILDEMNLSHVERYFSDILSSIESGEPIHLFSGNGSAVEERDGVPSSISLPDNLFIIGTVNIDETTYMFSPKVLDRANTIEFRVSVDALESFLIDPTSVDLELLRGKGKRFASAFLASARDARSQSSTDAQMRVNAEITLFFAVMAQHGNEFGFRTALEMSRFIRQFRNLSLRDDDLERAIDAQIYQKMLPRLSGSRARLEPVLRSLLVLCRHERQWVSDADGHASLANRQAIFTASIAASDTAQFLNDEPGEADNAALAGGAIYPLSESKILRMLRLLGQNGFTSFAEA